MHVSFKPQLLAPLGVTKVDKAEASQRDWHHATGSCTRYDVYTATLHVCTADCFNYSVSAIIYNVKNTGSRQAVKSVLDLSGVGEPSQETADPLMKTKNS